MKTDGSSRVPRVDVDRTEAHLRFVAEDPAALDETLERAIKELDQSEQPEFLESLKNRFSSGSKAGADPHGSAIQDERAGLDGSDDWATLVERLVAILPRLAEPEIQGLRDKLGEAGLLQREESGRPTDPAGIQSQENLVKSLGLRPEEALDPSRLESVLSSHGTEFIAHAVICDRLIRAFIRDMDPNDTDARPACELKASLAPYLVGTGDPSTTRVEGDIRRALSFVRSLGGLSPGVVAWAKDFEKDFDPARISNSVETGWFANAEARCWDTFKAMYSNKISAGRMTAGLKQAIADAARKHRAPG